MDKKFDVFISYRRTSYDTANLIATRLKSAGYSVFFDVETLRAGKFNEQLLGVIENCRDFIVVLPPEALDRCINEDDWVRREVCYALQCGKNVIPVMLNGFQWPDPMPSGMEELKNYQALTASSGEYFDLAMERLMKRFLTSRKHVPFRRLARFIGLGAVTLFLVLFAMLWTFRTLSKGVCEQYATRLVRDATAVHVIAEENARLKPVWDSFESAVKNQAPESRVDVLAEQVLDAVELAEENLSVAWTVDTTMYNISSYNAFLLSINGISVEDVVVSPLLATMYRDDFISQLGQIRNAAETKETMQMNLASALFKYQDHTLNSYYASVLAILSTFPESALNSYNALSPKWIYYPKYIKPGESQAYYIDLINTESALAENEIKCFESVLEVSDAKLDDIEKSLLELEEQASALESK